MLSFSESFNPFWKIKANSNAKMVQVSYPLYGLINGFLVFEDGEYTVYFEPQKYVLPSLIVSGFTFVLLISYLVISRKKIT